MRIEKGLQQNQPAPQLSDYDQDYGKITSREDAIAYVAARL